MELTIISREVPSPAFPIVRSFAVFAAQDDNAGISSLGKILAPLDASTQRYGTIGGNSFSVSPCRCPALAGCGARCRENKSADRGRADEETDPCFDRQAQHQCWAQKRPRGFGKERHHRNTETGAAGWHRSGGERSRRDKPKRKRRAFRCSLDRLANRYRSASRRHRPRYRSRWL